MTASEEKALVEQARLRFSTPRLQEHLVKRMRKTPPHKAIATMVELAAYHPTTVWTSFQGGVRDYLRERWAEAENGDATALKVARERDGVSGDSATPGSWQTDVEWTVLGQIKWDKSRPVELPEKLYDLPRKATAAKKPKGEAANENKGVVLTDAAETQPNNKGGAKGGAGGNTQPNPPKQPKPNKKQPLGKKEVGTPTLRWLGGATERCAAEFMALMDQLRIASEFVSELEDEDGVERAVEPRCAPSNVVTGAFSRVEVVG